MQGVAAFGNRLANAVVSSRGNHSRETRDALVGSFGKLSKPSKLPHSLVPDVQGRANHSISHALFVH